MKGIDYIIKRTIKETDFPEQEVKKLIEGYWKEVDKQLTGLESTTVAIRKVGVITVAKKKIPYYVSELIRKIRGMRKSKKYSQATKDRYEKNNMEKLTKILVHRNRLATDYAEKFGNI